MRSYVMLSLLRYWEVVGGKSKFPFLDSRFSQIKMKKVCTRHLLISFGIPSDADEAFSQAGLFVITVTPGLPLSATLILLLCRVGFLLVARVELRVFDNHAELNLPRPPINAVYLQSVLCEHCIVNIEM